MKRYLPFIIVGVVAVITVTSGAALYRTKRAVALSIPKDREISGADESMHVRGNPKAPVTVEEFGDFQCPPCGLLAPAIVQIEQDYGKHLRVIFHHLPLNVHAHAREAAWAAEAAGLQNHFWEMHDLLYREQPIWSNATDARGLFVSYAGTLGLDVDRFEKDMAGEEVKARVVADEKRAKALGVTNTPTLFVNNQTVTSISFNGLIAAIKQAEASANEKSK